MTDPSDNSVLKYYDMSFDGNDGNIYALQVYGKSDDTSVSDTRDMVYNSLKVWNIIVTITTMVVWNKKNISLWKQVNSIEGLPLNVDLNYKKSHITLYSALEDLTTLLYIKEINLWPLYQILVF